MKKLESGRSMVEMLGVLAIIGVLSIGGIAGYVLSMNRFRANAMLDVANKYAAIVFSSYQSYVAGGNPVENWAAPTLATSKLQGTLQPGTDIAISPETGKDAHTAISGNDVNVLITFPSLDICETALGVAGYQVAATSGTKTDAEVIPGADGSPETRTCSKEEADDDHNIQKSSGIFTFKQS